MWAASRTAVALTVLEPRFALLDEGGHAFLLVLERELRMEHPPLEQHSFGERGLVGAVDRLLDHHRHRQGIVRHLLRHGERLLLQLVGRHHARDEAGALGFLRVHGARRQAHVHRLCLADRPRQALRAARAGHDAEIDLGLAELRIVGGNDDVAHQRQLVAAAERVTRDSGDHRLANAAQMLPVARNVVRHVGVHVAEVLHGGDVRAGGERFLVAGDEDRADALIGIVGIQRLRQLLHQLGVERVEVVRAVERGDADPALLLGQDEFIAHDWLTLAFSSERGIAPGMSMRLRFFSTSVNASTSFIVRRPRTARSWYSFVLSRFHWISCSDSSRNTRAGMPATSERAGTRASALTKASAATTASSPISALSFTTQFMPISAPRRTTQPCSTAPWPTVTSAPTTVSLPGKPCSMQVSWILAPSSTTMRPKSPRR